MNFTEDNMDNENNENQFANTERKLIDHLDVCENFCECGIKIEQDLFP